MAEILCFPLERYAANPEAVEYELGLAKAFYNAACAQTILFDDAVQYFRFARERLNEAQSFMIM